MFYEIFVVGEPQLYDLSGIERIITNALEHFGLKLGSDVGWWVTPAVVEPDVQRASVVVFFGAEPVPAVDLAVALLRGVPVLPVVSTPSRAHAQLPGSLLHVNALDCNSPGPERVASAILEAIGLLPRQRRVFVSYRRIEARVAAVQLFDALTSKVFDVFLDTHGVPPGRDFQSILWHRLCDSDVLVMLDTETYFESRWTAAEFGRALAKGLPILRVAWPDVAASLRTATCSHLPIRAEEVDAATGALDGAALARITAQVELLRSRGHAVRRLNMVSNIREALRRIGGDLVASGASGVLTGTLADGTVVAIYPALGVPTSETLQLAEQDAQGIGIAVAFDHVGLHGEWLEHLEWLGAHVHSARWMKLSEAAWDLAAWGR